MSIFTERRTLKPAAMDGGREVPRVILNEILADAHRAPTHGLTQPWRFHVFTGAARARLAGGLQEVYDAITPAAARNEDKRAKLDASPRLAAAAVAVAARVEPGGKIPVIEEIAATACAVENLMLSACGKGIGSFWSTPPAAMSAEFGAWLGIDAAHVMLGVVYLGYAKPGGEASTSPRVPLAERVVFHDA